MKSASFDYAAPTTVAAALDTLAGSADGRILAGGQSLMPMLALRLTTPELVVDLGGIAALRRVELAGERQMIGAMVTHAAIEDGIHDFADGGMLAAVARGVAYRAVRNRGTLAGSIAHADPAADWPTALTALDAGVIVAGRSGEREIAVGAFFRGAFATALAPGEIVTAIAVPKLSPAARWGYYKICCKAGEFPDAIGAVVIDPARRFARIVVGALDGPPRTLDALAVRVAAEGTVAANAGAVAEAVAAASPGLDAVEARLHAVAVRRALIQALAS